MRARKKVLEPADLPRIMTTDNAAVYSARFDVEWEKEQEVARKELAAWQAKKASGAKLSKKEQKPPKPSLNRVIVRVFKVPFIKAGALKLVHDILQYCVPVFLNEIIKYVQ